MTHGVRPANERLKVIVLGYLVRGPLGGLAWHYLQYVLGLSRLGHDVYFVEDSDDYESCYDPQQDAMVADPSYGLRFAQDALDRFGLGACWAYYDAHTARWLGPAGSQIGKVISDADLMINVSGVTRIRHGIEKIPRRALVDTDPVFTQIRNLSDPSTAAMTRSHTCFFTFGEKFGQLDCGIPDDRMPWQPTRQPVVLDAWPVTRPSAMAPLSTVMQWDSYPALEYDGRKYGMKSESFLPYLDLPGTVQRGFRLAVGSPSAPKEDLSQHGWDVVNPLVPTMDPWTYQRFIAESSAEFGVAKHGYVVANSGWFSERTAVYLASGRPAVVQDTGFSSLLPTGKGLLAFRDLDTAQSAIATVMADITAHGRAAREIAEAYFDATAVLSSLIERCK